MSELPQNQPQEVARHGDGVVAFIDLSGFISVIEAEVSSSALWEEMRLMRQMAEMSYDLGGGIDDTSGLIFVGDAFLAYAFDVTDDRLEGFVRSVSNICGVMMHRGWRLRAGFAMGDLLVSDDRTHYLGIAVARAHRLESGQTWFGGAFAREFNDWLRNSESGVRLRADGYVAEYSVPMKEEGESADFALGWSRGLSLDEKTLRDNLCRVYPPSNPESRIIAMLDESVRFYHGRNAPAIAERKRRGATNA